MITPTANQGDIVYPANATCYGGPNDKTDNGIGAWGFPYRDVLARCPDFPYCALPIRGSVPSLANSPLPAAIPHMSAVHVFLPSTGKSAWCWFVDYGPSGNLSSGAGIDIGPSVVKALGYTGDPDDFEEHVQVRIIGCGNLLSK